MGIGSFGINAKEPIESGIVRRRHPVFMDSPTDQKLDHKNLIFRT